MIERLTWIILLYAMLHIVAEPPMASAAGCYGDKVVYTNQPATIRAEPHTSGAFVRDTVNGEGLYIINIRRANGSCWLQTNEGWLIFDPLVISDTYYGGDKEATVAGQPPCLKAEMATTTGSMNIRQSPSTSSPVVSSARAGDTFIIIQQTVSGKYCWLQVSHGWLAVTERVKAFRPNRFVESGASAPPAATAPSDIDNCCFVDRQCTTEQEWTDGYWAHQNGQCGAPPQFSGANLFKPRIEGSETFVHVVTESLNLMERKLPSLYQYIVSITSVIEEHGPDRCDWGLALGAGKTSLGSCLTQGQMPEPLFVVAAYLAHEACHHHGEDMVTGVFDHEPCYQAGHDAFAAMSA